MGRRKRMMWWRSMIRKRRRIIDVFDGAKPWDARIVIPLEELVVNDCEIVSVRRSENDVERERERKTER